MLWPSVVCSSYLQNFETRQVWNSTHKCRQTNHFQIYRYVLVTSDDEAPVQVTASGYERPGLLATCKLVRSEALKLYYHENHFRLRVRNYDSTTYCTGTHNGRLWAWALYRAKSKRRHRTDAPPGQISSYGFVDIIAWKHTDVLRFQRVY